MYKKHKIVFCIVGIILFAVSWWFKLDYSVIASEVATVISIVLAIYMTSFSSLISSELAEKMKNKEDEFIKGKSQLGVLRTYLNLAVASGILNIMLGCIVLLYKDILKEIYNTIYYLLSSIVFSTFGLNLTLMYLLYNFMVNRQLWSK